MKQASKQYCIVVCLKANLESSTDGIRLLHKSHQSMPIDMPKQLNPTKNITTFIKHFKTMLLIVYSRYILPIQQPFRFVYWAIIQEITGSKAVTLNRYKNCSESQIAADFEQYVYHTLVNISCKFRFYTTF